MAGDQEETAHDRKEARFRQGERSVGWRGWRIADGGLVGVGRGDQDVLLVSQFETRS